LSVNNVQVPFAKKLPQRTAEQDAAEAQRNQNWNPNAALAGRRPDLPKPPEGPASVPPANPLTAPPYVILPPPDPLAPASAQAPTANYFVQAGAFRRQDEAEHQRARLNMLDLEARVTTVDQSGQAIYRVRIGPMDKNAAETTRTQLELEGIDASLIFVKSSSSAKN
jgi:cell division protein FtsN